MKTTQTPAQFYNEQNPFVRRMLRPDSFYESGLKLRASTTGFNEYENTEACFSELLKTYHFTAQALSHLSLGDPALEHFQTNESNLRRLCFYAHMANRQVTQKQLCYFINGVYKKDKFAELIDICDVYNFGYKPHATCFLPDDRANAIVIDLRAKDFDNDQFLEAMAMLKQCCYGYSDSIEYAGCFFH